MWQIYLCTTSMDPIQRNPSYRVFQVAHLLFAPQAMTREYRTRRERRGRESCGQHDHERVESDLRSKSQCRTVHCYHHDNWPHRTCLRRVGEQVGAGDRHRRATKIWRRRPFQNPGPHGGRDVQLTSTSPRCGSGTTVGSRPSQDKCDMHSGEGQLTGVHLRRYSDYPRLTNQAK